MGARQPRCYEFETLFRSRLSIISAFVIEGALALLLWMCAAPRPAPILPFEVDATPVDPFLALASSCSEVCAQVVAAYPAVEVCLGTRLPADECMIDLRTTWGPVPLACSVRAALAVAVEKLRNGRGTDVDRSVIEAALRWIDAHDIKYVD